MMMSNMVHIVSKSIIIALSFLLLAATSVFAVGQTYYVSNTGVDTNSGTSVDSPWRTLTKVNGFAFQPGDTILFQRGNTWTGSFIISRSGTATDPIVVGPYGQGDKPIFRNPGGTWNRAISLRGSYIHLENLFLRDTTEAGIFIDVGSEHNQVRNIEGTALGQGVVIKGNNNLISHCYFHDLVMVVNTGGGNDDYGANGIAVRSSNNEISYNRIENAIAPSYDYGFDGGAFEISSPGPDMDNNNFHHNWTANNMGFLEIGGRLGQTVADNIIAYNLSYNNQKFVSIHLGAASTLTTNLRIENNTVVEPVNTGKKIFWIYEPATPSTLSFTNNIVYSAVNFGTASQIGFTHSNNLYYMINGASLGLTPGPTELVGVDPQFVSLSNHDFHLQPSSPAVDHGVNLGYTADLDNLPVPVGAPDFGTYELQSDTPPQPSPTPIPGDANQDGVVDQADYTVWFNHYQTDTSLGFAAGDFDLNTHVDGIDYVIWLNHL